MTHNLKIRSLSLVTLIILILSLLSGCKPVISLKDIPDYSGKAYIEINGGEPFFTDSEITNKSFEKYSDLDTLGRCGVAFACIGVDLMPTEDRGDISNITPSGWEWNGKSNNNPYDFVEGGYVYNRCHLIGFQLAGENDNELNLITGTRYMNIDGMLDFENKVAKYVKETENHVMYRVTPIYRGVNLVADGVLMEGYSVEDNGRGISFCIFAYNVQPGIYIDYYTGMNVRNGDPLPDGNLDNKDDTNTKPEDNNQTETNPDNKDDNTDFGEECTYILNTNSKKFHFPNKSCSNRIGEENREEFFGTREELIEKGYEACGTCKP